VKNLKPVKILEPGGEGDQCLSYRSLLESREGLEALQTSLKGRSRRRMRGRRRTMMMMSRRWRGRGGKDVEDSLMVEEGMLVKFPSVPLATCLLHLQLLLEGSFHQEEVKQVNKSIFFSKKYKGYILDLNRC
jgi:hypothetical protein